LAYGIGFGPGPGNGWMHAKLLLVLLVLGYHHACGKILKRFEAHEPHKPNEPQTPQRSHVWYRWFNEAPVLLLLAIVCLVVVKPF